MVSALASRELFQSASQTLFKNDPGEGTRHSCGSLVDPSWIEPIIFKKKKIMTIVLINLFIDSSHMYATHCGHTRSSPPVVPSSPLPPPGPHLPFISLFCWLFLLCDSLGLPRAHYVGMGGELSTRVSNSPTATPWTQ